MAILETEVKRNFPVWAVDFIKTNNTKGLSRAEVSSAQQWLNEVVSYMREIDAQGYDLEFFHQLDFAQNPQFGLPGDCIELHIHYLD